MRYIYGWSFAHGMWRLVKLNREAPMTTLSERFYNGELVAFFIRSNDLKLFAQESLKLSNPSRSAEEMMEEFEAQEAE